MKKIYPQKKSLAFFVLLVVLINISKHSTASCHAGFTWTQSSANRISFTSTSTGTVFSYNWSFGNGGSTSGAIPNLMYTYNMPGTYYVCLSLYDSSGMCDRFCDSVTDRKSTRLNSSH